MGCGKSTTAACFQRKYGMPVIEMDQAIAAEAGMPVAQIFEKKGEPVFRDMETKLLRRIQKVSNTVISCGGGVPMRQENVEIMKRGGKIVLLTAKPQTILDRVAGSKGRPLLEGHKTIHDIEDMMGKRRWYYESAADLQVETDGRDAEEICAEIICRLES